MGFFAEVHSYETLRMFFMDKVSIFSSTLLMTFAFHSVSTDLYMSSLLYHVSIQSLIPSVTVDLAFSHEMLFPLN